MKNPRVLAAGLLGDPALDQLGASPFRADGAAPSSPRRFRPSNARCPVCGYLVDEIDLEEIVAHWHPMRGVLPDKVMRKGVSLASL